MPLRFFRTFARYPSIWPTTGALDGRGFVFLRTFVSSFRIRLATFSFSMPSSRSSSTLSL